MAMGAFFGLFSVSVAVAVLLIVVRPGATTPVLRYDFSHDFTRVQLICRESGLLPLQDVIFYINGSTPITATRVSGYMEGPTSIFYSITQRTEGPVRCKKLSSGEYSDEVDLTGNPSVGIRKDQNISRPELLDPLIFKPVTLECDIEPGRLKHLYTIEWFQLFSSAHFFTLPKSMVNTSTFSLHLNSSYLLERGENMSVYQCSVTVKHGPFNTRQYYGRKIILYTAARVTITQCVPRITQANAGGPLAFNCTAKGNNISFEWSVCQNPIQRSSCASTKNLSMTTTTHMNTTPPSYNSQCSYSGQLAAGTYHVMCNVLQELGPAFSSRRLSRLSDGILLVMDGSTEKPSTEEGTPSPTSSTSSPTTLPPTTSSPTILTGSHITFVIFLVPSTFIAFMCIVLFFFWRWMKEKHANKKKETVHTLEESKSEELTNSDGLPSPTTVTCQQERAPQAPETSELPKDLEQLEQKMLASIRTAVKQAIDTNDAKSLNNEQKGLVTSSRQMKRKNMKVKKEEKERRENEYITLFPSCQNYSDEKAHISPKRQERRKHWKEKINHAASTPQQTSSAKESTPLSPVHS